MQQRQLGGALRFHVRCYYRPDAAAPTEAWPTDFAGNYHRRALHWLDPSGNDKAPVDRRGRLSAPTCPFWRAPHNSERGRGACGVAAPGAARIGATRRARDRLRPRRGWRRSVSGRRDSSSFTERYRDTPCSPSRFASKRHRFPSLRSADRLRSAARVCWPCDARLGAQVGRAHADFASSSASFHFDMLSEMIRVDVRAA